jgi:Sulfatase
MPETKSKTTMMQLAIASWTIGWTVPLLELIGGSSAFFSARDFGRTETILTIAAIAGLPVLIAVTWRRWFGAGGLALLRLMAAAGIGAILIRALAMVSDSSLLAFAMVGIGPFVGLAGADRLARAGWVRELAKVLVFSPVAAFLMVGFMPLGRGLLSPTDVAFDPATDREPRIVVLVFDEFPLASLVDGDGDIRDWYPNFRRLAGESVWFPDAVTVDPFTHRSVPAMLTGLISDVPSGGDDGPTAQNHPNSLFTLSSWPSGIDVAEPITSLCQREGCVEVGALSLSWRTPVTLTQDLLLISLHSIVAKPVRDLLPQIDEGWSGFVGIQGMNWSARHDRRDVVESAILRLGQSSAKLSVLHFLLPHAPWQFAGDAARLTSDIPAQADTDGSASTTTHRHLLQVAYADTVLGRVIDELQSSGRYDETTLVVVADHGISFRTDVDHPRSLTAGSIGEVGAVPFFVKLPEGRRGGEIDPYPAFTVDLLPTLAGSTGLPVPWEIDGIDLLGPDRPDPESRASIGGTPARNPGQVLAAAARIDRLFPDGDLYGFVPPGAPNLVGAKVEASEPSERFTWRELVDEASPGRAPPGARTIVIKGEIDGPADAFPGVVVVMVQGRVVAMGETTVTNPARFTVVVRGDRLAGEFDLGWWNDDGSVEVIPRD